MKPPHNTFFIVETRFAERFSKICTPWDIAVKTKKNYQLQQEFPPFVVPSSVYQVIHVHKHTSMETMRILVDHVQDCTEYTIDTESEKANKQLALIQIQSMPRQLPSFVILLELAQLSSIEPSIHVKIKLLLQMVFRSGNELYSWGNLDLELSSIKLCELFDWPIRASMRDIQCEFSRWYSWVLSHCEACDPSHCQNVSTNDVAGYINSSSRCKCHQPTLKKNPCNDKPLKGSSKCNV